MDLLVSARRRSRESGPPWTCLMARSFLRWARIGARALRELTESVMDFDRALEDLAEALRATPRAMERCARCRRHNFLYPDGPDPPYCAVCWDWWAREKYGGEPLN